MVRCRLRLCDSIYLFSNEVEIWLPLWTRLRLRGSVRRMLVHAAAEQWSDENQAK
jgi:hypothetical protein